MTGVEAEAKTALGAALCKLFGVQVAVNKDFRLVTGLSLITEEDPVLVYVLELCEEADALTGTGLLPLLDGWPTSGLVGFPEGLGTLGATGRGLLVLEVFTISSLNFLCD